METVQGHERLQSASESQLSRALTGHSDEATYKPLESSKANYIFEIVK